MDHWTGILNVPVSLNSTTHCKIAASLCVSPSSNTLIVPKANVVFFNGDRVQGTGNPVIDRLSELENIVQVLESKFGGDSVNTWAIQASTFNGPFAVYKEFFHCLSTRGEPLSYDPTAFPASTSVVSLMSRFCQQADLSVNSEKHQSSSASSSPPQTILLGFSKGGVVLNQLITELSCLNPDILNPSRIIPNSAESFLDSITEIHYIDVGLNVPGAYLTDDTTIARIAERVANSDKGIRFVLHGTPRQWNDKRRAWICEEKNKLRELVEWGGKISRGKMEVTERTYFCDNFPDLQMHFQIIDELVVPR